MTVTGSLPESRATSFLRRRSTHVNVRLRWSAQWALAAVAAIPLPDAETDGSACAAAASPCLPDAGPRLRRKMDHSGRIDRYARAGWEKEVVSTGALRGAQVVDWSGPAPAGATLDKVVIGPDPDGLGGIQIATATVTAVPTRALLDKLFVLRKGNRAMTLTVAATDGTRAWLYGPDPQTATIELAADQAARQLQSVLDEPDSTAAFNRVVALRKAVDSGGVGWANNGLFATYHLEHNVPARADWSSHRAGKTASRAPGPSPGRGTRLRDDAGGWGHPDTDERRRYERRPARRRRPA